MYPGGGELGWLSGGNGDNKPRRNCKFLYQFIDIRLPETTSDPSRPHRATPTVPRQYLFLPRERVHFTRGGVLILLVALLLRGFI
ncbi:UNVERIFIED_CONTAM: hypothetical protein Slati_3722900 [Sesamum latifolium]|uniref:Uncharacterized protein n=1 Tax=Sesamum latifolium TaxID=2727402 RepID=A0AAW2U3S0_9LAMI